MRRSFPGTPLVLPALAAAVLAVAALSPRAAATPETGPSAAPYLDPALDFEARARDLVSRMTVEEKVSQLTNQAAAIPRLGVPEYEWWNECLHGVARAGVATVFPQAIGLAATFDAPLIHEMAEVIGDEARAKHHQFVRQGKRGRYQGLTFWSPNINIFRDPRWGRGQETYGEDPFLAGRLGVAFVKGLQGDDPRYYKVIATAKHYAVHSGPEPDRHHFDARPSERDLWETYLPAFRDLVQEGKAASVMSAYNRVNGDSATASQRLLNDILRKQWGFEGYVVSDCGAVDDIFMRHKLVATAEEASALAVVRGCDLECGSSYRSLGKALERGLLKEADLDVAVRRLMLARMRLGMFDPPERVKYAQIPYSVNDAPEHDRLARRVAQESIVLLKNDGVLPLRKDVGKIAVVGPNADDVDDAPRQLQRDALAAGHDPGRDPRGRLARHPGRVRARCRPRGGSARPARGCRDRPGAPAPGPGLHRAGPSRRLLPRPGPPGRARAHAARPEGGLPLGPRGPHGRARGAGRAGRRARPRRRRLLGPLDGSARSPRLGRVRARGDRQRRGAPLPRRASGSRGVDRGERGPGGSSRGFASRRGGSTPSSWSTSSTSATPRSAWGGGRRPRERPSTRR